jgi:phospholipase/carboxylesterase
VSPPEPSAEGPGPGVELVHLDREAAGEPEGALILLHGRGVDERDLYPLLDELDPDRRLFGMTPGAPLTNVPPGGRHWYVVERVGEPQEETFLQTMRVLCEFLDGRLDERGIPWERTVIGGFSQGAAVSCAVAIGKDRPRAAGLLMMSGFYPEVSGWEMDPGSKRGMPAYVTHGAYDPVIPVEFGRQASQKLEAAGLEVIYRETPMQHGIHPEVIPEIRDWVASAISPTGADKERRAAP